VSKQITGIELLCS